MTMYYCTAAEIRMSITDQECHAEIPLLQLQPRLHQPQGQQHQRLVAVSSTATAAWLHQQLW
jgi:hypothetical protein